MIQWTYQMPVLYLEGVDGEVVQDERQAEKLSAAEQVEGGLPLVDLTHHFVSVKR